MYAIHFKNKVAHLSSSDCRILSKYKINNAPLTRANLVRGIRVTAILIASAGEMINGSNSKQRFPKKTASVLIAEAYRVDWCVRDSCCP